MAIAEFIQEYGYLAIALGSFLEGEAVLLAGSLAAQRGQLALPLVLPIAVLASFLGDLPYFLAGRRYGIGGIARFSFLQRQMAQRRARIDDLLQRHQVPLVLCLRFLYGFRIAGLLSLGMSRLPIWRFLVLDFIGAVIWACVVCATGYGAGQLVQSALREAHTVQQVSLAAAVLVGASLLILLARRRLAAR